MAIIDPGTIAEYYFAGKCLDYGYLVSWPSSKVVPYDVLVDNDVAILKIQVKATFVKNSNRDCYKINTTKVGDKPYERGEVDLLAAYVAHTNTWYILPGDVIAGKTAITLYPHRASEKVGQYEQFREAWHLLKEGK